MVGFIRWYSSIRMCCARWILCIWRKFCPPFLSLLFLSLSLLFLSLSFLSLSLLCVFVSVLVLGARNKQQRNTTRERERERINQGEKNGERERDVPQPPIYGSIGLMSVIRLTTTICNPISVRCPLSAVRCLSLSLSVCCCASVLIVLLLVRFHVPCCAFLFCFHFACTTKHDEPKAKV